MVAMKPRLWWRDADEPASSEEKMIDRLSLIAWFRESAKAFKSATSEGKPAPGIPPPAPALYWHGRNGRACPCPECCTGGTALLNDPETIRLAKQTYRTRRAAK